MPIPAVNVVADVAEDVDVLVAEAVTMVIKEGTPATDAAVALFVCNRKMFSIHKT